MSRKLYIIVAMVVLCGCQQSDVKQGCRQPESSADTKAHDSQLSGGTDRQPVSHPPAKTAAQMDFGPVRFTPPAGWQTREAPTAESAVFFAPASARWQKFGSQPGLGLRKRAHPGVPLERFRDTLDLALSQSTEQLNQFIKNFTVEERKKAGFDVSFGDKPRYTLTIREGNGTRYISSTCYAVMKLPTGTIVAKTCGASILGSDALYTIVLTFPQEVEQEMDPIWRAFEADLRIRQ